MELTLWWERKQKKKMPKYFQRVTVAMKRVKVWLDETWLDGVDGMEQFFRQGIQRKLLRKWHFELKSVKNGLGHERLYKFCISIVVKRPEGSLSLVFPSSDYLLNRQMIIMSVVDPRHKGEGKRNWAIRTIASEEEAVRGADKFNLLFLQISNQRSREAK